MRTFLEFMNDMKSDGGSSSDRVLSKFAHMTKDEMLPLPEKYDLYFKMDDPNIEIIPMKDFSNISSGGEGMNDELTMMYAASIGNSMGVEKLDPVSVKRFGNGKYEIYDGNDIFNIARESNWKGIPALIVDEHGDNIK